MKPFIVRFLNFQQSEIFRPTFFHMMQKMSPDNAKPFASFLLSDITGGLNKLKMEEW